MNTDRGGRLYRRRAPSAFAVPWDPHAPGEARSLLNTLAGVRYLEPEHDEWLYLVTPRLRCIVHPGDWLVVEDGDLIVSAPRQFEATYEEIP